MARPVLTLKATLTMALPSVRVRRKRMPHALQRMGFPFGPLRHWGELTAPQWQQGPARSCLALRRLAALGLPALLGVGVGL
jgi:hypothetical protein